MKIKFDEQQYQLDAMESITNIFEGQTTNVSNFSVSMGDIIGQEITELGIGNKLELSEEEVLENVQNIQMNNYLPKSSHLHDWNFTVEMETGTGKTYVYTRTIFELNKKYGFSKFIIVVPSVAIREGVYKSFQMTESHFNELYPGQHCHFFKYDSSKLEQVREYATSTNIEVMIINIDAFRKSFDDPKKESKANLIHRERDSMNGKKPIQFIQETNPIVIIDEPQSVDNTDKAKEAIASLHPLCKLRYSATHRDRYNLMYKLDPVDAYEKKLVKKIEVLSINSDDDFNTPYIKLLDVSNKNGYKATVEIDEQKKNGTVKRARKTINMKGKTNLYTLSGERDLYRGYVVAGIDAHPDNQSIEFENGQVLHVGEVIGGLDDDTLKRYQIREAIRAHLDKELKLVHQGVKVLTLFFLDRVENYRVYPKDGEWQKGKYALMFEEEYNALIRLPKYKTLFEEDAYIANQRADEVHDGYFSKDKKGNYKNSRTTKEGTLRANKDDESTFQLIMKEKERLLSFDTPLRFIFSHSALKEGWDNPNVFQICTLVDTKDILTKRQKIGRGLRLPVNQEGQRIYDENINVLTVVANESYEEFAATLQTEMEEETGLKFGYLEKHTFSAIWEDESQDSSANNYEKSEVLYDYFVHQEYLTSKGKITDKLKEAVAEGKLEVPAEYKAVKEEIEEVVKGSVKKLPVFNKKDAVDIQLNKEVLLSEDFKALWDQIKHKTTYSVEIDSDTLIKRSVVQIKKLEPFRARRIRRENAYVKVDRSGVTGQGQTMRTEEVLEEQKRLPDILRYLQEQTNLKRRTLVDILVQSKRLDDFKKNPQAFMETVMKIINKEKRKLMLDGIKYERIGDHAYYEQSLFENEELIGYMKVNALKVSNRKSVFDHIRYDSTVEREFAEKLNADEDVKLFVKLPSSFYIETPLGHYNPDWAVLIEKENVERLYFVVETKGTMDRENLRIVEQDKIKCGHKHFEALHTEVDYKLANDFSTFKDEIY
ncbi:type III restriction-modification system endonuclease [Oceanobacillus halotolerans]|uniref:type III restriction-modification system endonuclease n=1 Tax=Oceanobacillus halotolerans TaxID=2663380 RepID=UPI0013D8EAE9|nr:DEAD/DEAH box helicase family protein [Oceanobacillus halotolerans]